jgi:hypothetical protein
VRAATSAEDIRDRHALVPRQEGLRLRRRQAVDVAPECDELHPGLRRMALQLRRLAALGGFHRGAELHVVAGLGQRHAGQAQRRSE